MKQAVSILFASALFLASGISLWADGKNPLYENIVIETFDGTNATLFPKGTKAREMDQDGNVTVTKKEGQDIVWRVSPALSSRHITEGFPLSTYANKWPIDLFGINPEDSEQLQAMGVRTKFNRRGYNYFAIYPGTANEGDWKAQSLPLVHKRDRQGEIVNISVWVWGAGFDYSLEIHVRDYEGVAHILPMNVISGTQPEQFRSGSLSFSGWRKMAARVPKDIPQKQMRYSLQDHRLEFIKFVVRTNPYERVDDFYIYFDQMEATVDYPATNFYDGKELTQPDLIEQIWQEVSPASTADGQ